MIENSHFCEMPTPREALAIKSRYPDATRRVVADQASAYVSDVGSHRLGCATVRREKRGCRQDQPDRVIPRNRGSSQYRQAEPSGRGLARGQCPFSSIDNGPYLQTIVPFGMRVAGWPLVFRQ